jgi:hypothetical protein
MQDDGFSRFVIACCGQGDSSSCAFGLPQLHQVSSASFVGLRPVGRSVFLT